MTAPHMSPARMSAPQPGPASRPPHPAPARHPQPAAAQPRPGSLTLSPAPRPAANPTASHYPNGAPRSLAVLPMSGSVKLLPTRRWRTGIRAELARDAFSEPIDVQGLPEETQDFAELGEYTAQADLSDNPHERAGGRRWAEQADDRLEKAGAGPSGWVIDLTEAEALYAELGAAIAAARGTQAYVRSLPGGA